MQADREADRDTNRDITVTFSTIDRFRQTRHFKTLKGAQKYAQKRVGAHPDVSETYGYAVDAYGVGKVQLRGATFVEVFPPLRYDGGDLNELGRFGETWHGGES